MAFRTLRQDAVTKFNRLFLAKPIHTQLWFVHRATGLDVLANRDGLTSADTLQVIGDVLTQPQGPRRRQRMQEAATTLMISHGKGTGPQATFDPEIPQHKAFQDLIPPNKWVLLYGCDGLSRVSTFEKLKRVRWGNDGIVTQYYWGAGRPLPAKLTENFKRKAARLESEQPFPHTWPQKDNSEGFTMAYPVPQQEPQRSLVHPDSRPVTAEERAKAINPHKWIEFTPNKLGPFLRQFVTTQVTNHQKRTGEKVRTIRVERMEPFGFRKQVTQTHQRLSPDGQTWETTRRHQFNRNISPEKSRELYAHYQARHLRRLAHDVRRYNARSADQTSPQTP